MDEWSGSIEMAHYALLYRKHPSWLSWGGVWEKKKLGQTNFLKISGEVDKVTAFSFIDSLKI